MTIKEKLLILVFILQGCTSAPKQVSTGGSVPLLIETKIQTKDIKKSETHTANLEIILLPNQAIRMEVSALFGYRIASVVMAPQKIQYALHTSKSYVDGPFTARTLYPVFKQNVDPRLLWRIIHGQNPESADLKCVKDANGRPVSCVSSAVPNLPTTVTWAYEDQGKKRIEIKNQQFEMIWVFKSQVPFEPLQNETFVLKKPEEYKEISLK
ncbi:MAG: DUF4292 domain-containing protein [Bdellovibrio sp.]|nr:DUF4292 domain-containing protein [Bdellovibrio sp.]